jgi:hypothetical protein
MSPRLLFDLPAFSSTGFPRAHATAEIFRRRSASATPATRLSGNAETFAVMPDARRKISVDGSENASSQVNQTANGGTRTASIKKKAYENTKFK